MVSILALTTSLITALVSCTKSDKPDDGSATQAVAAVSAAVSAPPAAPPAAPKQAQAAELARSSYDESSFTLTLNTVGTYSTKQPAEAQIVLEPKSGFKCNDEYPYKFKLKSVQDLRFSSGVIRSDAMKVTKERGVMTLSFIPDSPGKKKLSGIFFFSVCTEDKCLIERRELAVDFVVN